MLIFPTYQTMLASAAATSSGGHVTSDLRMHLDSDSYSGSGDWLDATSNNNDGTIDGATYVAASGSNPAYFSFDGTNDAVSIDNDTLDTDDLFDGTNDYSISLWFQTSSFPASTTPSISPVIFKAGRRALYLVHGDIVSTNVLGLQGRHPGNSWLAMVNSNTLSLNTWYNICFTYNASNGYVCYQNDSSVDTSSNTTSRSTYLNNHDSFIGKLSPSNNQYNTRFWEGKMAIFSIYEKTLTSSEVTQNYNAFKSRYGLS